MEEHHLLAEPGACLLPAEEIPEVLSCDALVPKMGNCRGHAGLYLQKQLGMIIQKINTNVEACFPLFHGKNLAWICIAVVTYTHFRKVCTAICV